MSFLVTFNGQFSPYVYRIDAGHPYAPRPVQPVTATETDSIHEILDFEPPAQPQKVQLRTYQKQQQNFQNQRARIYAREIMSSPLHTIQASASIAEAIEVMARMGFRHLPVLNKELTLVGLISDRETSAAKAQQRVEELMKPQIIVALDTARVTDVAHLMLDEKLNALPVVNHKHKLTGIITLTDILKVVIAGDQLSFGG